MAEDPATKPKAQLLAFVSEVVKRGRRFDYYATTVDETGNVVGQHTGPSPEDCRYTLLGMRPGSPWPNAYDEKFPQGYELTWVDDPTNDPRVKAVEERYRRDYKEEGPSGPNADDAAGNPEELFDASNQPVKRGPVAWEPTEGSFDKVQHPMGRLENREDWRAVRVAMRVFSDPLIADSRQTSTGTPVSLVCKRLAPTLARPGRPRPLVAPEGVGSTSS